MDRVKLSKANDLDFEIKVWNDTVREIEFYCKRIELYKFDGEEISFDSRMFKLIKEAIISELKKEIFRLEGELERL